MNSFLKQNLLSLFIFKKYFRYFFTSIFIIVGIIWLTRIVKYIDYLTVKNMSIADFTMLSVLLLPMLIDFLLPIISIIAIIFTFNSLVQTRELYILKASGLPNYIIIKPIVFSLFLLLIISYIFTLLIVPFSYDKIEKMKRELTSSFLGSALQASHFNRINNDLLVYVDSKDNASIYTNLVAIQNMGHDKYNFIFSEKAKIFRKNSNLLLGLNNGERLIIDFSTLRFDNISFAKYITDLDFFNEGDKLINRIKKPSAFYFWDFYNSEYIKHYDRSVINTEFHHRLLWPILLFLLSILVSCFFLSSAFVRKSSVINNLLFFAKAFFLILVYFVIREYFVARNNLVFVIYFYMITILLYSLYILLFSGNNLLKKGFINDFKKKILSRN